MSAANELRPVQVRRFGFVVGGAEVFKTSRPKARVNLELMMKRQLQLRRDETLAIHKYVHRIFIAYCRV